MSIGRLKPGTISLVSSLILVSSPVVNAQDDNDLDALFGGSSSSSSGSPEPSSETSTQPQADSSSSQAQSETVPVVSLPEEQVPPLTAHNTDDVDFDPRVEEIVVTARKRSETIQEVPLSVTPFSAADLEQRGMAGLDDIAASTAGFTFEAFQSGGAHGNAVIRGLSQQFTTSRIQNVSFFLDGVYLQRQSMLDLGMIDMERVEVVKGPQNALYGRNAFAGAVNYITLVPSAEPYGYLMATTGDNGREQYRFTVSGPIGKGDNLFGKISGGFSRYDGHTKNNHPVANADPVGDNVRGNLGGHNDQTFSASLGYNPIEGLRTRASIYRSELVHETGAGYGISGVNAARFGFRREDQLDLNCNEATVNDVGVPSQTHQRTGNTLWCGEIPNYASDASERTVDGIVVDPRAIGFRGNTRVVTLGLDYDIFENLTAYYLYGRSTHDSYTDGGTSDEDPLQGRAILTNAIAYSVDYDDPNSFVYANTASGRPNSTLESFSHELRFDWEPMPRLRSSAGLYFSKVEDEEWSTIFVNDLCNADTEENISNCNLPLSHPNRLAEQTVMTVLPSYDLYTRQHGGDTRLEWTGFEDTIAAVFASASYDLTDSLEATLEARYSQEKKAVTRFTDSSGLGVGESVGYGVGSDDPTAPVIPGLANPQEDGILVPRDSASYSYFTPRAIVNWEWSDNNMLYASVAKGVKSGGFNNSETESELTYDAADNWTYELGSKNSFFGRLLTLNGAVYFIDWAGLQGGIPPQHTAASSSDIITNLGGATSLGAELEGRMVLPFGFSFDFNGTWNDAQYGDEVIYSAGREEGYFHCQGEVCPTSGNVGGNQLARTSAIQAAMGINYSTALIGWDANFRIDASYQSKQYMTPLNVGWVPERMLTNASFNISSPDGKWEMISWGKNLTDEDYPANAFVLGVFNQYLVGKGPGRTWGTSLKFNF